MTGDLVLVTGGTGFVGVHCLVQALDAGYAVRTTVRSAGREGAVRDMLQRAGVDAGDRLSFAVADLTSESGWSAAVDGATYVLHVASPFPVTEPKDPDELIVPARDGALRVLRASRDAGVRRVVLTSSFAAVGYGHNPGRPFTEEDWTNLDGPGVRPYVASKAIAERAAWDWVEEDGGGLELATVNPVGIFGPALGRDLSSSVVLVQALLNRTLPAVPHVHISAVDVRDVASLHLLAMMSPTAAGERFLAVSGEQMSFLDVARVLRDRLGDAGRRVPTHVMPDWVVRLGGLVNPQMRSLAAQLGPKNGASSAKARRLLGWQPRSGEDAIEATGRSLIDLGLVKA